MQPKKDTAKEINIINAPNITLNEQWSVVATEACAIHACESCLMTSFRFA